MNKFCTIDDVTAFLLKDYVDAAVGMNATIVEDTIVKTSGEIKDILAHRYSLTTGNIPQLVQNIAAVFTAYRIMAAITGIVNTESGSENVWIPLQREYKQKHDILMDIAKGSLKLPLAELKPDREDAQVWVVSKPSVLELDKF